MELSMICRERSIAKGWRIGVVVARENDLISDHLFESALDALARLSIEECICSEYRVPTCADIPGALAKALEKGDCDGILVLGCIIAPDSPSRNAIAKEIAANCIQLSIEIPVPIGYGVFTVSTQEEAYELTGINRMSLSAELMQYLLEMIVVYRVIRGEGTFD
jgi:6,7-dimethyl-8-ribityllumazine synthase